eukprot:2750204-Rhodomonas_salina.1
MPMLTGPKSSQKGRYRSWRSVEKKNRSGRRLISVVEKSLLGWKAKLSLPGMSWKMSRATGAFLCGPVCVLACARLVRGRLLGWSS